MNDYLLFIDTEASGLPKNWSLPYNAEGNWPHCVQISWVIFTRDERKIKEEDHYIKNNDFEIAESAIKIHGITSQYLQANGEDRKPVLQLLVSDLAHYKPLVVGHFIQFDIHILGADFHREKMEFPIKKEWCFCTMLGSTQLIKNPSIKFLRLEQLYSVLFNKPLKNLHNAVVDANATAQSFFEMCKLGQINEEIILQQQSNILKKETVINRDGCLLPLLVILCMTILIFYL